MVKIISWNIAHRAEPWHTLLETDADIALFQEAAEPPSDVAQRVEVNPGPWLTGGKDVYWPRRWRTAVVKLSDRVRLEWIVEKPLEEAGLGELAVSRVGTLSAAKVTPPAGEPFIAVSMYSPWTSPHSSTGSSWILSDVSAHRVISDLSAFIGSVKRHRVLAAGDLNVLHGYGEHGDPYFAARYQTIFSRMEALGLDFKGPQAPRGRQADPWPDELPKLSKNVPTYSSNLQTPATATRQLDFVFVSVGMSDSVAVAALNRPDEWGPSDHCRLEIEVS